MSQKFKTKKEAVEVAEKMGLPINKEDGKPLTKKEIEKSIVDHISKGVDEFDEGETVKEIEVSEEETQEIKENIEAAVERNEAKENGAFFEKDPDPYAYPQLKSQLKFYRDKCKKLEVESKSAVSLAKHNAILKKVSILQKALEAKDAEIKELKKQK
ncbi:MAG: hypothetical protein EX254_09170 [Flavobacteriaceae bacterium]|nr:MAG: hypothetical protein EX254_09170 [Flavobacteriaceae bacterium]